MAGEAHDWSSFGAEWKTASWNISGGMASIVQKGQDQLHVVLAIWSTHAKTINTDEIEGSQMKRNRWVRYVGPI